MKQFKHKKFIGLALIVFLVFMVLGKYTQKFYFIILQEFMPQPLSISTPKEQGAF